MTATVTGASSRVLGVEDIRRQFPALTRVIAGTPVAYFDGPGGTQVPRVVVEAMMSYVYYHNANTHWEYPASRETDEMIAGARGAIATFFNAAPEEIVFGQNMTSLTFHLARGLAREWSAGDEIVVTELDHHANVAPWKAVALERGLTLRTVLMQPEDGTLDWADLERAVTGRTRLVAVGAASNALGTITDVAAVARLAHAAGALVFVDAVHYAAHELVDVQALDCDFLACSAYKFYGPHVGILYGKRALLDAADVPRLDPAPAESPERIETGTQNHEGIAGAAAAVDYVSTIGGAANGASRAGLERSYMVLHHRAETLFARLWNGLADIAGVRLFGLPPGTARTPTVAFTVPGRPSADVANRLGAAGIFVSHGDFYAPTVIERLGQAPAGVVRAGCACYTTTDEIDRLVSAVAGLSR